MGILNSLEMYFDWLLDDPLGFIIYMLYMGVAMIGTLVLHECAHGYAALRCGDPTAKMLGRLTLNPLKHLDPVGTVCMLFLHVGWAKPVPVNPRNYRNARWDDVTVSVAGIVVNLTLFIACSALSVLMNDLVWNEKIVKMYGEKELLSYSGIGYSVLAGGAISGNAFAFRYVWAAYIQRFLLIFGCMNLGVGVFNLLPVPPLDGFHLFNDILLRGRLHLNRNVFQITMAIAMVLCISGAFSNLLNTVTTALGDSILNVFLLIFGKA